MFMDMRDGWYDGPWATVIHMANAENKNSAMTIHTEQLNGTKDHYAVFLEREL